VYLAAYRLSYNVGHQIGNACWPLCETFLEGIFLYFGISKLFPPIVMFTIVQNRYIWQGSFLVSLGVNDYPWEIVGLDLVTDLNKSRNPFNHYY
jgi:hypothetical protein